MTLSLSMVLLGLLMGLLYLALAASEVEKPRLGHLASRLAAWDGAFACYLVLGGLGSAFLVTIFHANQWLALGISLLFALPVFALARWIDPF